jgi:hypothetical protein
MIKILLSLLLFVYVSDAFSGKVADKGLLTLHNPHIKVKICPQTGKLLFFGKKENLLWCKPRLNKLQTGVCARSLTGAKGGNRLYPAQQKIWHSICSKEWSGEDFDKLRWSITETDSRKLTLISEKYAPAGLYLIRQFELDAVKMQIIIKDTAYRYQYSPFPVQLWTVTQLPYPKYCVLDKKRNIDNQRNHVLIGNKKYYRREKLKERPGKLIIDCSQKLSGMKIGTLGTYIAAVYEGRTIFCKGNFDPAESYPDGASIEFYGGNEYIEMEVFSPEKYLKVGEKITLESIISVVNNEK